MAQQSGTRSSSIAAPPTLSYNVPLTGDELFAMGDIGRVELVKGEVVPMSPTGHAHGFIEVNFAAVLHAFVHKRKLGRVLGGEVGIYTHRNPDTVRGADVAFISNGRLAQVQSIGYLDVAPELIVEVMSPDDRWGEVNDKLAEYFAVGVQRVWVADPRRQQIHVYRSQTEIDILSVDDTLTGDELLPGFSVAVADIFDPS
jgi:Uma2 family endonuclease